MLKTQVNASSFSALSYAVETEVEEVLAGFSSADRNQLDATERQLAACSPTNPADPARVAIHSRIINSYFSIAAVISSTPAIGTAPRLTLLGGRGGSGKSWFKSNRYNPQTAIVVDADDVKSQIPEFQGWNAAQVHDESTALVDRILDDARALGLNVVLDATMKTSINTTNLMLSFAGAGYEIEAFYMFLPRYKAAHRAIKRFLGTNGRYVPVSVVLANTQNELTFDQVKLSASAWGFFDNDVQSGNAPILIAQYP